MIHKSLRIKTHIYLFFNKKKLDDDVELVFGEKGVMSMIQEIMGANINALVISMNCTKK